MAKVLTVKFIDGSYKECEVTGRDMGGEDVYYKPMHSITKGTIKWTENKSSSLGHRVNVVEIGEDYLTVDVTNWRGINHFSAPRKLTLGGGKLGESYYFGEWNYYYSLELIEIEE